MAIAKNEIRLQDSPPSGTGVTGVTYSELLIRGSNGPIQVNSGRLYGILPAASGMFFMELRNKQLSKAA